MEEENTRILEFGRQQQAREAARMEQQKAEEEGKAAVLEQLSRDIHRKKGEQEEMERWD